ncbi:hypothetical protein KR51_00030500 [Rubidibacter lacunae KORDI 51-2]|uniref:Uncharacterized protein n=1 Tax=Rubidibacter lacunae KORDI 51-2 TaxID=582515 RepID=U5D787_9CHRO|nr:hypothetical protein [Rubidibacter lacunae]ERN40503.1 hypothetical protein KR51_00030500 [Rubidibacter lacunae KORDI 51-2]
MPLKIVNKYDTNVTLTHDARNILFSLLSSTGFTKQVCDRCQAVGVGFAGLVFPPVPYSEETPHGMPVEFEPYHFSDDYLIVNVPPKFMFQAKVFQPSRLCAIYRLQR